MFELSHVPELAIHRCETYVGDLVESPQFLHQPGADLFGRHLAIGALLQVGFDAIGDRNEADRWRDRYVLAPRAELPEPPGDQVYLYDLLGLTAEAPNGEVVGRVQAYYELKHDLMIEVQRDSGSVMIPYRFVTEVDLEGKRLVVEPPEGLL